MVLSLLQQTPLDLRGPLTGDDQAIFDGLANALNLSRTLTIELNDYYETDHQLQMLGLAIPPELQIFNVALAWPRVTVDAVEQRLDVTGFRLPGQAADGFLWENWQFNDLDAGQTLRPHRRARARPVVCVCRDEPRRRRPSDRDR
jgi:hypothetical protein